MPAPNPFPSSQQAAPPLVPALNLFPLNDSFIPKHIHLNQRVKIGRQTNAKTVPGERNGYFDSKVLSRQHAEVWEENSKIYIKDVKSSNGTFINGDRLSPEGVESEPVELKTDDIVEFGIDIVGEDNKTIIHHKVAARVTCILSPEDALAVPRDPTHYSGPSSAFQSPNPLHGQTGQPNHTQQRRPGSLAPPNPAAGLGSMGAPAGRPGGTKSGLTFDHILSRLQSGLLQSRETGQELGRLGDQMGDISDTLGGSNPGLVPSYPQALPPVRPHVPDTSSQQPLHPTVPSQQPPPIAPAPTADMLASLQSQLAETQSTLAAHVEKIRALERLSELGGLAKEHEAIKREVGMLRGMIGKGHDGVREVETGSETDEDETRSIATVTPDEEDAREERERERERAEEEEMEERRQGLLGRPRTPEPTMGMDIHRFRDDDDEDARGGMHDPDLLSPSPPSPPAPTVAPPTPSNSEELVNRLTILADQLESALAMSRSLQAQQTAAQTTIQLLEAKVVALEELVQHAHAAPATVSPTATPSADPSATPEPTSSPTLELLTEWQRGVEKQWSGVREEWSQERLRLDRAREEWEGRMRKVEMGLGTVEQDIRTVESELRTVGAELKSAAVSNSNAAGGAFAGLVTPPSPRSLSADSNKPRRRKSRSRSGRRSRSPGPVGVQHNGNAQVLIKGEDGGVSVQLDDDNVRERVRNGYAHGGGTPPSLDMSTFPIVGQKGEPLPNVDRRQRQGSNHVPIAPLSTAVGVLILSVAAAVAYRARE